MIAQRQRDVSISAGAGAVVMGTGIVSVALSLDGALTISRILLVLAALVWLCLAGIVAYRLVAARDWLLAQARTPAALTGVAGTAVLASRLLEVGWPGVADVLLVLASAAWLVLMPLVLSALPRTAPGEVFMVTVATEAVGVLSAQVALAQNARWLVVPALVLAGLGVAAYPFLLVRFPLRELRQGEGDQWVAGGSLAISALAVANVALASKRLHVLTAATGGLDDAALAIWIAAALWLVPLVLSELRWPRPAYSSRRWATVFPLGMYAVCSSAVALASSWPVASHFGRVWVWAALAGWGWVTGGLLGQGAKIAGTSLLRRSRLRPKREEFE